MIGLNGPAILYGVARGVVAQATANCRYGKFVLPAMNFVKARRRKSNPRGVDWLVVSAGAFETILCGSGLISECFRGALTESANEIVKDLIKNKVDINNLSTEDLGLFASTDRNLHLLTMHKAKGREFDAVAVVDLHDGRVPDFRAIKDGDLKRIEEDKRLLYVSITRARRFLMYVTDEEDRRSSPSRFLCEGHLDLPRHN